MVFVATSTHSLVIHTSCMHVSAPSQALALCGLSISCCSLVDSISRRCKYIDLHDELVPYRKAWDLQRAIVKEKKAMIETCKSCPDTVIVLQHHPVFTLGTGSSTQYVNFCMDNPPFDVIKTERGGEVTYHGPGQLVMYPIINLRNHKMDLHWYLRALEEVVIRVLSSTFGIKASQHQGLTGVWVGDLKLAAVGIRVSNWITYHGLALNVSVDLSPFQMIVPCGIRDRGVGSIKSILGKIEASDNDAMRKDLPDTDDLLLINLAHESLVQEFSEVFQLQLEQQHLIPSIQDI